MTSDVPVSADTAAVGVTLVTVQTGRATKTLLEDHQGNPYSPPDENLALVRGVADHVVCDGLDGFASLLASKNKRQCLVLGVPKQHGPGAKVALVTSATLSKHPGAIARTREHFTFPTPYFVFLVDDDPRPEAPVTCATAQDLMALLVSVFPPFATAGWVARHSTRSAIKSKATGEWLRPPSGKHVYCIATGSLTRFATIAKGRLWLAGTGYCMLATPNSHTGVASVLERCLIDLSVWTPEHIDYISGALIAKNASFYQDRPEPEVHAGSVVDLDAIPDLTANEEAQYRAMAQEARDRLAPERTRLVRRAVQHAHPDMGDAAVDDEVTARLHRAERGELTADHPLLFDNGKEILVKDLTKKMHGWTLADPQEPDYGRGKAKLFWDKAHWVINSWAHGILKTYRRARPEPHPQPDDDMADLMDQADEQAGRKRSGIPTRFHLDEKGLWYTPEPEEDGTQPPKVKVCAPLHVVAATRDEDSNHHGHLLEFLDRHDHPQQWAMPLELLEEQREYRKVLRRLGLRIRGATRTLLQEYLEQIDVTARARCVARVGWVESAYVIPGAVLGESGAERLVLQTMDQTTEGYRQKGSLEGWRDAIALQCIGNSRLLFAVSAAFAAPLLVHLDEESGGVHFRGTSSEGKTTTIIVAGSVWGEPERLENWRATANALEAVALAHNDNLLGLDELKQVDPKEAGSVAYMLANGVGKRRSKEHGGLRTRLKWRLLFLSTGELSLEKHMADAGQRIQAGQEVRLVDLPADAGANLGLFENLHQSPTGQAFADLLKALARQHYGHAGRAFVTRVAQDLPAAVEAVRKTMDTWLTACLPPDAPGQVYRVARRFALIGAAGELATERELTGWPVGASCEAAATCFQDWLAQRGGVGNTDEARAVAQVRLFFEQYGRSRFEPWREGEDGTQCQRCHGTGRVDHDYMQGICFTCDGTGVITPDHPALRLIQVQAGWSKATDDGGTEFYVQQQTFRQVIAHGLDVPWLCRLLKSKGYLRPGTDGKNTRKETVPGHPNGTRVYRITEALLGTQTPGEKEKEEEGVKIK